MPPTQNLTGLIWYLDVHVMDLDEADELLRMGQLRWIYLQMTDTALTEVGQVADARKRDRLNAAVHAHPVAMGPAVWGHSLWDQAVFGSDDDQERINTVYRALWPNNNQEADARGDSRTGLTRFRDALHVATSIRYGGHGFVTNDRKVLTAALQVAAAYPGFAVLSVADATAQARQRIASTRQVATARGGASVDALPDWP